MSDVQEETTVVNLSRSDKALEYQSFTNKFNLDNILAHSQEALEEIFSNAEKVQDLEEGGDDK